MSSPLGRPTLGATHETTPDATVERVARIVAGIASGWYAIAVFWGLFSRIGGGHETMIATRAIVSENMRLWHTLAPVKDYTFTPPGPEYYYVHHPWGTFWAFAAFSELLGRGTWVPRLVGVLMSVATPPLLYSIGRILWGPVPGAVSALAYTVLPIALAFGNMPGFEVPLIFGCVLTTWGYLKFAQRWDRRWMAVSIGGVIVAANSDWEYVVFLGLVLFCLAVGGLVLPRWYGRVRLPQFAEWWVLSAVLSAVFLLGYVAYFQHLGLLEELIHSETQRSRGDTVPLSEVLRVRSYWIDVCFTPLVVTIGKIAAPIFVVRILLWRRLHEVFPFGLLAMSVVQYVKFKNGADVHIFWPMPFAPYWALALGMLSATTIGVARWLIAWPGWSDRQGIVALASLAIYGLVALRVLPDGIRGLVYSKATAGRFNEKGRRIFNDADLTLAQEWMAAKMVPNSVVAVAKELNGRENRGQEWALHHPMLGVVSSSYLASPRDNRYYVGDLRFLGAEDQRRAASFQMVTLGPYVYIDRDAPHGPVEAFAFEEREPNLVEWYLANPTEPVRTVRPDPWATWELREHYEQQPNPAPPGPPRHIEEVRIAQNLAVANGDTAGSERYTAQLLEALDKSVASSFPDGTRLLGKRYVPGVDPKLELYFLSSGPLPTDAMFEVSSSVEAPPWWSLVPADDKVKVYGQPFVIAPHLWRKGFIYVERVDLRFRPGREYFAGYFDPAGAQTSSPGRPPHGYGVYLMTSK